VTPHFDVPLNLPHAGTIALRLQHHLGRVVLASAPEVSTAILGTARQIVELLTPYRIFGENPPREEAAGVVTEAAALVRALVGQLEAAKLGDDRAGQAVRNLFECFELGEEGATISLRAGENPSSPMRPR